ncbi:hypothetical protein SDC9_152959 [bioreactor metagenome]|uniref:Uncharacterized protein n=1 Tax=bioreactor metagenome TaxID=1076179 RepID=A0A645EWA3_9ZZZZ
MDRRKEPGQGVGQHCHLFGCQVYIPYVGDSCEIRCAGYALSVGSKPELGEGIVFLAGNLLQHCFTLNCIVDIDQDKRLFARYSRKGCQQGVSAWGDVQVKQRFAERGGVDWYDLIVGFWNPD